MDYSPSGITIELGWSCVTKIYSVRGPSRISHLRVIYDLLRQKGVPNVDGLLNSYENDPRYGSIAYLQPKGVNRDPTSPQEVRQAVLCLLETLVVRMRILCLNSTILHTLLGSPWRG